MFVKTIKKKKKKREDRGAWGEIFLPNIRILIATEEVY